MMMKKNRVCLGLYEGQSRGKYRAKREKNRHTLTLQQQRNKHETMVSFARKVAWSSEI